MNIARQVPATPCYAVDKKILTQNLETLKCVEEKTGAKIILSLKGFAMFSVFPLIKKYLSAVSASSLDEARLGFEEFGTRVHVYAPAYKDNEFEELLQYASHIVFNSFSQYERFRIQIADFGKTIQCGLRINPEHSEVKKSIYDPCAPYSRLGITCSEFGGHDLGGITGLHFHTLCELGADSLERTLERVEEKFGNYIRQMKWINFGGGHFITQPNYDIDRLCRITRDFRERYDHIDIFLEPSAAIALNAGVLVTSVLDIAHNKMDIAILDTSACAHMPDVLEGPYRPQIEGAGEPGEYPYTYRLGGITCLAGDVLGDYSFPERLKIGDRIVFKDMAHYTMVKNNTFNGVHLPSIVLYDSDAANSMRVVRQFGYEEYRRRLS